MPLNSITRRRPVRWLAALLIAGACTSGVDRLARPSLTPGSGAAADVVPTASTGVVISQVYGGGGNAGATYKNDFIEIYNGSASAVNLTGWSVQYASATGTSWQVTNLTGTLQSGQYYLVQEAAGTTGTTNLPTPDATGTIAMAAGAGKVALVSSTTALASTTGCPFTAIIVDYIGYGSTANCVEGTATTTTLTNTTAALRKDGGRQDTNDTSADFAVGAPAPRNTASALLPPANNLAASITPANPGSTVGATINFTASASQGGSPVTVNSAVWTSSNTAVATIDASTGVATTIATGTTSIGVTVSTSNGPASTSTTLTVAGAPATVTVTPATWSLKVAQTKQFAASAKDAGNNTVTTTYTWSSSNTAIATIDPSTGIATGQTVGSATITATAANGIQGTATINVTPATANVTVTSRATPLPVGFQNQSFVGGTDLSGTAVTTATWSTSDASIITTDQRGIVTAKGIGSAQLIATAADGSSGQTTITTEADVESPTARTGHNTEFGVPADGNTSDDIMIFRKQYTISWNPAHAGPNWVSWNLSSTHLGSLDRCNCFSADTALTRQGYPAYTTQDYVTGNLWDRGHMEPSADQTTTDYENANTFFLSNVLPQKHDLNAGPWEKLEIALRDSAHAGREVYVIAGGIFTNGVGFGTLNNGGLIGIPDSTWKIAIILPAGAGLADVHSASDMSVVAVNMPNVTGIIGNQWQPYMTTIAKLQASTHYDFLSALPEAIQCVVEVRNCAPVAAIAPVNGATEGSAVVLDATGSTDSNNDALTYSWNFGDGSTGTGATPSHTYADNGSYSASVTVNDGHGGSGTVSRTVTVANVAPVPSMSPSATTVHVGAAFSPQALFTDAGTKDATWHTVFTWGDGTSLTANVLTIPTTPIRASKAYSAVGTYTVRFTVTDKDGGSAFVERVVTVIP